MLNLTHNGLDDLDGAVILESLIHHPTWKLADLSHNCLGGGAALVACQVMQQVAAPTPPHASRSSVSLHGSMAGNISEEGGQEKAGGNSRDGGFGASSMGGGKGHLQLSVCIPGGGDEGGSVGFGGRGIDFPCMEAGKTQAAVSTAAGAVDGYWQQLDRCRRSTGDAAVAATGGGLLGHGHRLVALDGNPLGASAVQALMLAVAGTPAVAAMQAGVTSRDDSDCGAQNGKAIASGEDVSGNQSGKGAPAQLATAAVASSSLSNQEQPKAGDAVGVSIQGCSLMSKEKGFRCSLSDTKPALAMRPAVPLIADAVIPAVKGKGPSSKPSASAKTAAGKGSAGAQGAQGSAAAGGAAGTLVYTEKALGWDIGSPAGRYSLNLHHPATACIVEQLLLLKQQLGQLQALQKQWEDSVKAQQQQQGSRPVAGVAAARSQSGAGGMGSTLVRGRATRDNLSVNGSKSGRRTATPSRRQTRTPSPVEGQSGEGEKVGQNGKSLRRSPGSLGGDGGLTKKGDWGDGRGTGIRHWQPAVAEARELPKL